MGERPALGNPGGSRLSAGPARPAISLEPMTTEPSPTPRNARREAQEALGSDAGAARVLEPSPPAVDREPYFADDPIHDPAEGLAADGPLVVPVGVAVAADPPGEVVDYDQWLAGRADHDDLAQWAANRWLGGPRRLPPTPPLEDLVASRLALHRLAAYVIAPVRHQANGKFGLRWTLGGFGTPFFAADRQVRVEGTVLIDQNGHEVRQAPITSLHSAADFLGSTIDPETAAEHDSPEVGNREEVLAIDPAAADFIGHWFGMAFAGLESLRADDASINPSRPQLWPGHFDPAIEAGTEDTRASYGASPGDGAINEPYLYVGPWTPDRLDIDPDDPFWNGVGFTGRILKLGDFPGDVDPATVAADFWRQTRDRLSR